MKEAYLIIETGYEGIQTLCYLTLDKTDAVFKLKEFQDKKVEAERKLQKEMNEHWIKEGRPELVDKTRFTKRRIQHIKDFFCVQKWNGEKFKCVCKELGVAPSKLMLR